MIYKKIELESTLVSSSKSLHRPLSLLSPGNTHFPVTVMFKALAILHHFCQLFQILACLFETCSIMVTLLGAEVKWLWWRCKCDPHFCIFATSGRHRLCTSHVQAVPDPYQKNEYLADNLICKNMSDGLYNKICCGNVVIAKLSVSSDFSCMAMLVFRISYWAN